MIFGNVTSSHSGLMIRLSSDENVHGLSRLTSSCVLECQSKGYDFASLQGPQCAWYALMAPTPNSLVLCLDPLFANLAVQYALIKGYSVNPSEKTLRWHFGRGLRLLGMCLRVVLQREG